MKQGIKYGLYLGGALILVNMFYYFFHPSSLYLKLGKAMLFESLLYAIFMFLAIAKSYDSIEDSGTFFKIAFVTLMIGMVISFVFRYTLSHVLSDELNLNFLEAHKADEYTANDFFGQDPLITLEEVELMEHTIEDDMTLLRFLKSNTFLLLLIGIPFTILVSFLSRKFLKFRNKNE